MKKLIYASGLLALLATATSCEKYDIYPEEFDSVFTIRDAGTKELTLYATDAQIEYPVTIMKGGYDPETQSTATLKIMNQEEFDAYNENLGGLPYVLVAPNCYTMSTTEQTREAQFVFDSADKKAVVANVYIKPAEIHKWIADNADVIGKNTPVIPITLVSETDTVNSYGNVELLKVAVYQPEFHFSVDLVTSRTMNKQTFGEPGTNDYEVSATISIPCNNPWGFNLNLVDDPNLVDDYNDDNGTSYRKLDKQYYEVQTKYEFAPGVVSLPIKLTIKPDDLVIGRIFAVALRFANPAKGEAAPIEWYDENNNPGEALKLDTDRVMIFTIRVLNNMVLEKVNLNDSMVTGNDIEATEGSIANLFDGNTATYFHSSWTAAKPREEIYASYLQIALPTEMTNFRFKISNRASVAVAGYIKKVHLFGSNDPNNWPTQPFAVIDNMNAAGLLDGSAATAEFGSDMEPFTDNHAYKYIRFCVMESGGGSLGAPSTSVFWHASELELYGK